MGACGGKLVERSLIGMAFLSSKTRDSDSTGARRPNPTGFGKTAVWLAVPAGGLAFVLWSVSVLTGVYAATAPRAANYSFLPMPAQTAAAFADEKADRVAIAPRPVITALAKPSSERRFALALASVGEPGDIREKLTAAIRAKTVKLAMRRVGHATPAKAVTVAAGPAAERFGPHVPEIERSSRLALALAGEGSVQIAYAPQAAFASDADSGGIFISPENPVLASLGEPDEPIFEAVPDNAPVPLLRPREEESRRPERAERDRRDRRERQADEQQLRPEPEPRKPARRTNQQSGTMMAYARPDNPGRESGGLGQAFRNLFSPPGAGARAGNGVAVYDIAAATVTMPDGTRLEAHSGIGPMADNVRYVNQKMRGPTPPDTYNLSMRESRFHGVEAIRLTPADGRVKHGRTGLLAHSYLLRGGRAESHGCVAFKDYDKFLKAFKQGKIRKLVVVGGSSRGKGTAVADNGRGV